MEFPIIDSQCHWGPSMTLGSNISTDRILKQMKEARIDRAVIMPFPSTAARSNEINVRILNEAARVKEFLPYFHIRDDLMPSPGAYYGCKWHRMKAGGEATSNYSLLEDPEVYNLIDTLTVAGKPLLFEEDLRFTKRFAEMAPDVSLIVPHLGMNGGDPKDFLEAFRKKPRIFFNTALVGKETILTFLEAIGSERLLFASNAPFGGMEAEVAKIISLPVPETDKERILGGNVARLSGLSRP